MLLRLTLIAFLLGACGAEISGPGDDDEGGETTLDPSTAPDPAGDVDVDADLVEPPTAPPHLEAFFAVPTAGGTEDAALENKIVELIGMAPAGSTIRMSMFQLSRTRVANAFVAAANRHVTIHIILDKQHVLAAPAAAPDALAPGDDEDGDDDDFDDDVSSDVELGDAPSPAATTQYNPAVKILLAGLPAGSVTFCTRGDGSCIGNGIDHNKIYTFSSLSDGSKAVVVQSSANLTTRKLHNNLVISRNDKALYDGYVGYFNALKKKQENLNYYRSISGDHTITYFYPRSSGDTINSVLDKVKCTSTAKIRVAMAFFTSDRASIATRLVHLRKAGCDVQVVMRHAGTNVSASIIKTLRDGHVKVGLYPDAHSTNIHSKYLLIDAKYDTQGKGFVHRQLVFTGSHNYTGGALRHNDEALMRVDNATVFAAFMHNWNTIRAQIP